MRLRLLLFPVAALLPVLAVSGAPASAQGSPCAPGGPSARYPPSACGLTIAATQARRGESVTVAGAGFGPNTTVTLEFRSASAPVSLGSAPVSASGTFSTTVVIPADAPPGPHAIVATGVDPSGATRVLSSTITVLGAQSISDALPRTGASITVPAGIAGTVLVGTGALAIVAARRRRTPA